MCHPNAIQHGLREIQGGSWAPKGNRKGVYSSFRSINKYKYHDLIKLLNPNIKMLKRKGIMSSPCEKWFEYCCRDTSVIFYSQWCRHCQKLTPTWTRHSEGHHPGLHPCPVIGSVGERGQGLLHSLSHFRWLAWPVHLQWLYFLYSTRIFEWLQGWELNAVSTRQTRQKHHQLRLHLQQQQHHKLEQHH